MARVKMIKMLAGPDGAMHPGKTYEVADEFALALVEADACLLLEDATAAAPERPEGAAAAETMTRRAPESASRRGRNRS